MCGTKIDKNFIVIECAKIWTFEQKKDRLKRIKTRLLMSVFVFVFTIITMNKYNEENPSWCFQNLGNDRVLGNVCEGEPTGKMRRETSPAGYMKVSEESDVLSRERQIQPMEAEDMSWWYWGENDELKYSEARTEVEKSALPLWCLAWQEALDSRRNCKCARRNTS